MDEIINKYANDVKRFCITLCHNEQMAEELTQETFFRALKTINKYDGSCSMTTWLFIIARRVWIDSLRKKKDIVSLNEVPDSLLIDEITPEVMLERKMKEEYLYRIINELSEKEYSIFVMKSMLNKSFKDIGKEFNKTENWARVTYFRIRMKLIERMKKDEDTL